MASRVPTEELVSTRWWASVVSVLLAGKVCTFMMIDLSLTAIFLKLYNNVLYSDLFKYSCNSPTAYVILTHKKIKRDFQRWTLIMYVSERFRSFKRTHNLQFPKCAFSF